jgi:hypothetical protein
MMGLSLIITIPHTAIGLLLVYATLAGLLNRTVITVTFEFLVVWNGPVPWWGNRRVPIDELARLYCHKDSDAEEHGGAEERGGDCVYGVYALTKGANEIELVTELGAAEAQFILQELEHWLRIGGAGAAVS